MSEDKRTKIGTGTVKAVAGPSATPAPIAQQDSSKNATEFMDSINWVAPRRFYLGARYSF